jgi:hypothetical protein
MKEPGTPDDPSHDDPITMLYLDGDRLVLTHYCDAGNRPRMAAKMSPDGKTLDVDFLDVAGSTSHGHMHHAVFTITDANHHTEDWTYMSPETSSSTRTWIYSARNDGTASGKDYLDTGWTVNGTTVSRFIARFAIVWSR